MGMAVLHTFACMHSLMKNLCVFIDHVLDVSCLLAARTFVRIYICMYVCMHACKQLFGIPGTLVLDVSYLFQPTLTGMVMIVT
jgi:hypothetical protein